MPSAHEARCKSSRKSVVNSTHEPTPANRVVINAIEPALRASSGGSFPADDGRRMKMNFQVPFVVLPGILLPPISGSAPRAGGGNHFAAQTTKRNARRIPFAQFDCNRQRRPESAECRRCLAEIATQRRFIARRDELAYAKFARAMRVH